MNYKEKQKEKQIGLIKESAIFNGDKAGGKYRKNSYPHILLDGKNNLFPRIVDDVLAYFQKNSISWWGGNKPTGNVLSSQIACLNHLFLIRNNQDDVLKIAQKICPDFESVMQITSDEFFPAYIAFEAVSDNDYLNECKEGQKPTRGNNCTSIDALIYAKHKDGKNYILPIEWKYTEHYYNTDKSIEDSDKKSENHKKDDEAKGKERLDRYCYNKKGRLIDNSDQLKSLPDYKSSVYFFEPFYQLMRQTLWAEQMIAYKEKERIKADKFIHVHVIPQENQTLLKEEGRYKYKSGKDMKTTWSECLSDQGKYKIVSPKELLANIDLSKYADLKNYLGKRYW